jgi:hypothetical protein
LRGLRLDGLFTEVRANLDTSRSNSIADRVSDSSAVREHQAFARIDAIRDLCCDEIGNSLRLGLQR